VFVSFCLYGRWNPDALVVPQKCKGMKENLFLALCQRVGLLDDFKASPENLKAVHRQHRSKDTSGLMSFASFVSALAAVSKLRHRRVESVLQAVLDINQEGRLHIHMDGRNKYVLRDVHAPRHMLQALVA